MKLPHQIVGDVVGKWERRARSRTRIAKYAFDLSHRHPARSRCGQQSGDLGHREQDGHPTPVPRILGDKADSDLAILRAACARGISVKLAFDPGGERVVLELLRHSERSAKQLGHAGSRFDRIPFEVSKQTRHDYFCSSSAQRRLRRPSWGTVCSSFRPGGAAMSAWPGVP